jgi:dUTP pyrophosphatase
VSSEPLRVHLRALDPVLEAPRRVRPGDAGLDLTARDSGALEPGERQLVPTGFAIAVPAGACGLLLPRSGLALHHGITLLNSPGLIDSGYRGELKVILVNHGQERFEFVRGQRIAQLLILPVPTLNLIVADVLPPAPDDRGHLGFGSSG